MHLLPEDTPAADALRAELRDKLGGVHLEVGRFVASEPSLRAAAGAPARERGFEAPPEWTELSSAEALPALVKLLARGIVGDATATPRSVAAAFAARIRALFSERAVFFRKCDAPAGAAPITAPGQDSSLFIVDGDRAGLLWVEDEGDPGPSAPQSRGAPGKAR